MNSENSAFENCSFCSTPVAKSQILVIQGKEACICGSCVLASHRTLAENSGWRYTHQMETEKKMYNAMKSMIALLVVCLIVMISLVIIYK
ncbi:MAG: hypothetical protein K2P88_15335 [Chitinophagaceae bacterium]|nr:hypothetical protein [Chitinophagaceae bacterium]